MHRIIYCFLALMLFVFSSCGVEDVPVVPEPEPPVSQVPSPGENEDEEDDDVSEEPSPVWNADYMKVPQASDDGCIYVDRPEEFAAFLLYGSSDSKIKIDSDLDMSLMPDDVIAEVAASPKAFTGLSIDGGAHVLSGFTGNALLREASDLYVRDIIFEGFRISSDSGNIGALVCNLNGDAVFHNVVVRNAVLTAAEGNAGGMVGAIARANPQDRNETVTVVFEDCSVVSTYVAASSASGKFVGMLSGYDDRETLSFCEDCSSAEVTLFKDGEPYSGLYVEGNEGKWLTDTDFSSFDNFLGDEASKRGTVMYGPTRFVPQWDGSEKIEPLAADPTYDGWPSGVVIYSAYDLAYLQGKSLPSGKYYLLADVDMGGDEGYIYESISDVAYINGVRKDKISQSQETLTKDDNHTIYDVKVVMKEHVLPGAAFILHSVASDTRHLNLNFVGADIYNGINLQEGDLQYGNAYAGTLVSMVEQTGHYTVNNVHCSSGVVEAVCKMGGLIGHMCGDSDVINCSVDDYIIKNSRTGIVEEYNIGPVYAESNLYKAYGSQWWYTEGDAGGLIGFIAAVSVGNAYIKDCSVTDTQIDCYGSEDKYVPISVYIWRKEDFFSGPEDFYPLVELSSLVAGRHVNQFIGAIDSDFQTDMFVIEDYYVSGNSYFGVPADEAYEYNHQYAPGEFCDALGCAYYVGLDIVFGEVNLGHYGNCAGTLKFKPLGGEWVTVTEAPGDGLNMAWTGGGLEY